MQRLDRRLLAFVVGLCALQVANNLLPYLGLRDDSCQTMFSGLDCKLEGNNHLLMPQRSLGDLWLYLEDVEIDVEPAPRGRTAELVAWLRRDARRYDAEALRVVTRQICDAGHRVRMRLYDPRRGAHEAFDDACAEPRLSSPAWWIPVRLYEPDLPAREAP